VQKASSVCFASKTGAPRVMVHACTSLLRPAQHSLPIDFDCVLLSGECCAQHLLQVAHIELSWKPSLACQVCGGNCLCMSSVIVIGLLSVCIVVAHKLPVVVLLCSVAISHRNVLFCTLHRCSCCDIDDFVTVLNKHEASCVDHSSSKRCSHKLVLRRHSTELHARCPGDIVALIYK
jgi:hypothetical protein